MKSRSFYIIYTRHVQKGFVLKPAEMQMCIQLDYHTQKEKTSQENPTLSSARRHSGTKLADLLRLLSPRPRLVFGSSRNDASFRMFSVLLCHRCIAIVTYSHALGSLWLHKLALHRSMIDCPSWHQDDVFVQSFHFIFLLEAAS